jgi:glycosyltransferase involved in cell wall biosynthesis
VIDVIANSDGRAEIHLFEPSGYGGVFQHTWRLAKELSSHGRKVVLHTGHEHEVIPAGDVDLCECSWWPRPSADGAFTAAVRRATIARRLITRTVPHLARTPPRGSVVHLQGVAASGALNVRILAAARAAGHRVVYSPHDVFSRRGVLEGLLLRVAHRVPHDVIVYSRADEQRLRALAHGAIRAHVSPLVQVVPVPTEQERESWRSEWGVASSDTVVLFAGFIRPEKRLDVLVESARSWPPGRRLAVVGPDRGGWGHCEALAQAYGIDIAARLEFVELSRFTAAIAAADLVVVPSECASQSGVLAVARQLRTPAVAADVGGMGELALRTFDAGDAEDLSRAIAAALVTGAVPAMPASEDAEAVSAHLRAYGLSA